ncbi:hypothetical protein [Piscinibacter sakaiensis]|nr:hypothetical protein [Piscinibacter sakaiensis]
MSYPRVASLVRQSIGETMGKKSREKRERRERRERGESSNVASLLIKEMQAFRGRPERHAEVEAHFLKDVAAVEGLLRQYARLDASVALGVSDLWPPNVASPVKHVFVWAVLLGLESEPSSPQRIETYEDFSRFATAIYAACPSFPSLEDFSPEADWGQVRARLGDGYVPMFYGSSVERLPDFVKAFRITHAGNGLALADMDLAVAIHADLIGAIPGQDRAPLPEPDSGHVGLPPREFWESCRAAMLTTAARVDAWGAKASPGLTASMGAFKAPLTWGAFGDAVMTGKAAPFLGVRTGDCWVPVSARSGPGVVIDHWAQASSPGTSTQTHRALGQFVAERFRHVYVGPMNLVVGRHVFSNLPVSCAAAGGKKVHLFCACDHESLETAGREAKSLYAALKAGGFAHLLIEHGRALGFGRGAQRGLGVDDLQVTIVVTQSGTGFNMLDAPKRPTRVLPLVDLISVFDSLEDFEELERFWAYVDEQQGILSPLSRGLGDLFASFKDAHGVLVGGAITPSMISLDPHWGSSWRFRELCKFWAAAPRRFPDNSDGWRVRRTAKGVAELQSRHHAATAYSTEVGSCTVQALLTVVPDLNIHDGKMLDLFAQMVIDGLHDCASQFVSDQLLQRPHLVLSCELAESGCIDPEQQPAPLEEFDRVVVSASAHTGPMPRICLALDARVVQAGLNGAIDASFQARCLEETLGRCAEVLGHAVPPDLHTRLATLAAGPARYHLQVAIRTVDVPEHADPVVPTQTEYKLARKALAVTMKQIGLVPGRYELQDAKVRINSARDHFRRHIEERLMSFDQELLSIACVEEHDELLLAERLREMRVRQSRAHAVDYDRVETLSEARREFGTAARDYRYLLEKTLSSTTDGKARVDEASLRELIGLIHWYMVLAGASDVLHNEVDVGGVEIDDSFIPEVFYSATWQAREEEYVREQARIKLGDGIKDEDAVEGPSAELLADQKLQTAFRRDVGFDLRTLLQAITVLAQPVRHGLAKELASVYLATRDSLVEVMVKSIEGLGLSDAATIVSFLTLSREDIRRLPGRLVDEADVPFWEHSKRLHRYAIRPLVPLGKEQLTWGAEHASRSMHIWLSAVRDGVLPADFPWPHVQDEVRAIKESIEAALEDRAEEIFRRHTPYVAGGVDFFRRFRDEKFDDVGDFDVLAYWPETNTVVFAECKYNRPPHCIKDSRRLRDLIFGRSDLDRKGQFSRIRGRREFLAKNRQRLLGLLKWPHPADVAHKDVEVYLSRDLHYWMIRPPYAVPTRFLRVDALDAWIVGELKPEQR